MSKPTNLFYIERGNCDVGFKCDAIGNPYLPAYLSYRGSKNLLDIEGDHGREFQADLIDGRLVAGHDFRFDTVNPTLGAGSFGRLIPTVESCEIYDNTVTVSLFPFDYTPESFDKGAYRSRMIEGRYPECGWKMVVTYVVTSGGIHMITSAWHTDEQAHIVHQFRPSILYLNPELFQYPLVNEKYRDVDSWLSARINDYIIRVKDVNDKVKVTFTGGVIGDDGTLTQRQFKESTPEILDNDGNAEVWEAMVYKEYQNKWVKKNEVFMGWGNIAVQPTRIKFDLAKFREKIMSALRRGR